ncbi:hypothetical protein BDR04DRAFT_1091070, partial [Suillus decipiens]
QYVHSSLCTLSSIKFHFWLVTLPVFLHSGVGRLATPKLEVNMCYKCIIIAYPATIQTYHDT